MKKVTGYQLNGIIRERKRRPFNYRFVIWAMAWGLFFLAVWADEIIPFTY